MYSDILDFWFDQIDPSCWWTRNDDLDQLIIERFSETHCRAIKCELFGWRETHRGRLAEIIVLDQFSRNMFRDSALAFASDPLALALAQEAIAAGAEKTLKPVERSFLYTPFMHSESREIHQVALALYEKNGLQDNYEFEIKHKQIIDRFGRYPHRNSVLGRLSTEQEREYLSQPGAGF